MPWKHCEQQLNDDVHVCPTCEASKTDWTLEWNATREFTVGRKKLVRIELLDAGDRPVGHEGYLVDFGGDRKVEGELNEDGFAKVSAGTGPTECQVVFPARAPAGVVQVDVEGDLLAQAQAYPVAEREEPAAGFPGQPIGKKLRFRLAASGDGFLDVHVHVGEAAERQGVTLHLYSTDEAHTVASSQGETDDGRPGDGYLDVRWENLPTELSYSLRIDMPDGQTAHMFRDVPYAQLKEWEVHQEEEDEVEEVEGTDEVPMTEADMIASGWCEWDEEDETPDAPAPIQGRFVHFLVRDAEGAPAADLGYVIETGAGERAGRTDEAGLLHETDLPEGDLRVRLEDGGFLVFELPEPDEADEDDEDDEEPELQDDGEEHGVGEHYEQGEEAA